MTSSGESPEYELVIRRSRGWFNVDLAEIWRYRDLLLLLVNRDFVSKYKQTILGPAWFILQPLMTTFVFTVIFSRVAKIPTNGAPPMLFYLTGLLGWNYFAQSFQSTSGTLVANAGLFGKVYFPRLVVPLSAIISNLAALGLQLLTLIVAWAYFKIFTSASSQLHLSPMTLLLPAILLQIAALSLGIGLWLSALTAKYRDFAFLSGFIIQIWMYATPVIYPLSRVPERWRWLVMLNPMAAPVEGIRIMALGQGIMTPGYLATSLGMMLLVLASGVLVFNKVEKTFIDTV